VPRNDVRRRHSAPAPLVGAGRGGGSRGPLRESLLGGQPERHGPTPLPCPPPQRGRESVPLKVGGQHSRNPQQADALHGEGKHGRSTREPRETLPAPHAPSAAATAARSTPFWAMTTRRLALTSSALHGRSKSRRKRWPTPCTRRRIGLPATSTKPFMRKMSCARVASLSRSISASGSRAAGTVTTNVSKSSWSCSPSVS